MIVLNTDRDIYILQLSGSKHHDSVRREGERSVQSLPRLCMERIRISKFTITYKNIYYHCMMWLFRLEATVLARGQCFQVEWCSWRLGTWLSCLVCSTVELCLLVWRNELCTWNLTAFCSVAAAAAVMHACPSIAAKCAFPAFSD